MALSSLRLLRLELVPLQLKSSSASPLFPELDVLLVSRLAPAPVLSDFLRLREAGGAPPVDMLILRELNALPTLLLVGRFGPAPLLLMLCSSLPDDLLSLFLDALGETAAVVIAAGLNLDLAWLLGDGLAP
jgi:hypothetical protein